jgi:hypothetical protein
MLVASSGTFGRLQLGAGQVTATPAEEAQVPQFTDRGLSLTQAETQLRTSFAKLLPDLIALQVANKDVPAEMLVLMQAYNKAQATLMEAARVWLQARNNTPAADLPDPDAQPIAIPTFDLPSSGFGMFGAVKIPANAIKIRHGIVGKEVSTSLNAYKSSAFAGYFVPSQLGAFPVVALFWLLGVAIVSVCVVLVVQALTRDSAINFANRTISDQARARVEEVKRDADLFASTRDACIGNTTDQAVRFKCIEAASDALAVAKGGRPEIKTPITKGTVGILTVLGVLVVLGTASGVGYVIYKRRSDHKPRAAKMRSTAD